VLIETKEILQTSLVAIIIIMTMLPTTTLNRADACAAYFAATGDRAPIRFPTRADAATPIPKGIVFKTVVNVNNFFTDTGQRIYFDR
jgi:hypothetical protein